MCEPTTLALATFALSAAGTAATVSAQQSQAKAQNRAAVAAAENANQSTRLQIEQEQRRIRQVRDQETQRQFNLRRQIRRQESTARVQSAEAGVAGVSVDALLGQINREGAEGVFTIGRNFDNALQQSEMNLLSIASQSKGRNNSAKSSQTAGPSSVAAGLQLAGSGLDAYTTYQSQTNLNKQAGMNT